MDGRELVLGEARAAGFHHARIARAGPAPAAARLREWLAAGHAADMDWIGRTAELRCDPMLRRPAARSVLVLGVEHAWRRPPEPAVPAGRVARYAWGRDYHNLAGRRLRRLRARLRSHGIDSWGGVDTAPILERSWASAAGLGFGGRNCSQILPGRGSWLLLGALFLDLPLEPDPPSAGRCGRCRRCLPACPTGAIRGSRRLDSRRCISYWTIEARGSIPEELRPAFGQWVFGCDACQEPCPHNAAPPECREPELGPRNAWLDLVELLETRPEDLLERFRGTPLRRPGPDGLKRNACVVLGNLGRTEVVPALRATVERCSPLVAEHARWALERLGG